jgi:hypothetical protein
VNKKGQNRSNSTDFKTKPKKPEAKSVGLKAKKDEAGVKSIDAGLSIRSDPKSVSIVNIYYVNLLNYLTIVRIIWLLIVH